MGLIKVLIVALVLAILQFSVLLAQSGGRTQEVGSYWRASSPYGPIHCFLTYRFRTSGQNVVEVQRLQFRVHLPAQVSTSLTRPLALECVKGFLGSLKRTTLVNLTTGLRYALSQTGGFSAGERFVNGQWQRLNISGLLHRDRDIFSFLVGLRLVGIKILPGRFLVGSQGVPPQTLNIDGHFRVARQEDSLVPVLEYSVTGELFRGSQFPVQGNPPENVELVLDQHLIDLIISSDFKVFIGQGTGARRIDVRISADDFQGNIFFLESVQFIGPSNGSNFGGGTRNRFVPTPFPTLPLPSDEELPIRREQAEYPFLNGDPVSLETYTGEFTEAHAKHLLEAIGMGVDPEWLAQARGRTLEEYVDLLVDSCGTDNPFFQHVDAMAEKFRNYSARLPQVLGQQGFERPDNDQFLSYHRENLRSLYQYLGYHALKGSPVCISVFLLLHQLLSVNQQQALIDLVGDRHSKDYISLLMRSTGGNFQTLVSQMAGNAANLFFLDNIFNRRDNYNENYARELLELHALGPERCINIRDRENITCTANYDEEDVKKVTRAVTGFDRRTLAVVDNADTRVVTYCTANFLCNPASPANCNINQVGILPINPFTDNCRTVRLSDHRFITYVFDPSRWFNQPQLIFGANQVFNINPYPFVFINNRLVPSQQVGIVDNLTPHIFFNHPAAAWKLAVNFASYFISPRVSEIYITQLANFILNESAFDLRRIMKKILTSNAMFARDYKRTGVKMPFEWIVGLFRTMKLPVDFAAFYFANLANAQPGLIQNMFDISGMSSMTISQPPSVFGFPAFRGMFRSRTIFDGAGYLNPLQVLNRVNGYFTYIRNQATHRIRAFDPINTSSQSCRTLVDRNGNSFQDCPLVDRPGEFAFVNYIRKLFPQVYKVLPEAFDSRRFSWVEYLIGIGVDVNDVDQVLHGLIRTLNVYHTPAQYERLKRFLLTVPWISNGSSGQLIEEGCGWIANMSAEDKEIYLHHKISLAILMISMNPDFWVK